MTKKISIVLGGVVLAAGVVFAQPDFRSMPKNTVTVDVGPTIVGLAVGPAVDAVGEMFDIGLSGDAGGFGIGGQYERQLSRSLSAAGRLAYLRAGLGLAVTESIGTADLDMKMSSISAEGHVRFYPFGETFFVDGLVGYARLAADLDGNVVIRPFNAISLRVPVNTSPSRNYVKLGAKLGWRINFGRSGGFTFEPALGYSFGIGLGDTLQDQVEEHIKKNPLYSLVDFDIHDFDDAVKYVEQLVFIGGPRLSLAFGWRF